jgi:excisionase family DNA binding protein
LSTQPLDPVAVSPKTASHVSGFGLTTIYKFMKEGKLKSVKVGTSRRIDFASLKALLTDTSQATTP